MTHLTGQCGSASQSEITYEFPAQKICVTDRRVNEFWNTKERERSRSPEQAGSSSVGRFFIGGFLENDLGGWKTCPLGDYRSCDDLQEFSC